PGRVRIVAHQGGQVERDGEARLAVGQEVAEPPVRFLGGAEAGELPHGPQAAPVHGAVNAAGVRIFARIAQVPPVVQVFHVIRAVQPFDGQARDGEKALFALSRRRPRRNVGSDDALFGAAHGASLLCSVRARTTEIARNSFHMERAPSCRPGGRGGRGSGPLARRRLARYDETGRVAGASIGARSDQADGVHLAAGGQFGLGAVGGGAVRAQAAFRRRVLL